MAACPVPDPSLLQTGHEYHDPSIATQARSRAQRWTPQGLCLPDAYDVYIIAACGSSTTPAKAAANLRKHGVSFANAEGVLEDPLAITVEDPDADGEPRFVTVGLGSAGEQLVAVWTEREGECRLISVRRPKRKERKLYES